MAFTVPEFPLAVDVYTGPWLTKVLRFGTVGNLALGRRGIVFPDFEIPAANAWNGPHYLLLPPGTDVRDLNCNQPDNDIVEVPSGSGRWYGVALVDDVGKGFPNEHRYAMIFKISQRVHATLYAGLFWPTPIP